ncbi:AAA family ATPase [Kitasatospora sp. NPDC002227]|uniref:ATP-dependent nuclease n=1 Tax=Kitasatospora sp. NPDC002227 TaxID=3154773 RepID=UPI00331D4696
MELIELNVTNFRSLLDVTGLPIHHQTILTGRNDCGKTTTLDAIAFLLGETSLADSDISHDASKLEALASDSETTPQIHVEGIFRLTAEESSTLGLPSQVSIRRLYAKGGSAWLEAKMLVPEAEGLRGIDDLSLESLRKLGESLEISPIGKANAKASWIEPLKVHCASAPKVDAWVKAPAGLQDLLPQMLYFRGDVSESPESVVRSILSASLREHSKAEETQKKISELEEDFSNRLLLDAERLRQLVIERCGFDDFNLAPQVQFKPTVGSIAMTASVEGQGGVSLSAAGAGRARRVALALWEGTQELLSETPDDGMGRNLIIAYDEPDTHLDYEHQRRIMKMIRASSSNPRSTVIVATHSLNLIDGVDIQDIVHLDAKSGRAEVQLLGADEPDEGVRRFMSNMATSLGFRNSVLLHEKCFVGVEGVSEYSALPILFKLSRGYPIQSSGIALWSCGGNDGSLHFARFLKEHKRTVAFIVDSDSRRDKEKFFNETRLSRYGFSPDHCIFLGNPHELEDVFSSEQWARVANEVWPRRDERPWTAEEIENLRPEGKFSKSLHGLIYMNSDSAPRGKDDMVMELAQRLREPAEIPEALVSVFDKIELIAQGAGQDIWLD